MALTIPLTTVVAEAAPVPAAVAAPSGWDLPQGWRLTQDDGRASLVWTSPVPVPIGDARIEVEADGRVLGPARLSRDARSLSIPIEVSQVVDPATLRVLAGGRRLDAAPVAARQSVPDTLGGSAEAAAESQQPLPTGLDPGRPGPWRTRSGEYVLDGLAVPNLPAPVEMRAVVVAPIGASGPRPLALLLHGRHFTCYLVGGGEWDISGDWPCPPGWAEVPSHRGYLQMQQLLASQGWLTVSISANGINGQDYLLADGGAAARSRLIRAHLQQWADWSRSASTWAGAPAAVRSGPRPELAKVLLMGHSRGGEGANRASMDSNTPTDGVAPAWRITGQVLIAPTAFGQNPAAGVDTVVLLPYCDGDVFDLQGQEFVDAARDIGPSPVLRSAVMIQGANHNYFNSEWTPGESVAPSFDDWFDPTDLACGDPRRLTPAAQRTVGATYLAGAARALTLDDDAVLPLLDGSPVRAESAGRARVATTALGARRGRLVVPDGAARVTVTGSVTGRLCGTDRAAGAAPSCADGAQGVAPHFLPFAFDDSEPTRRAVRAAWRRPGGSVTVTATAARPLVAADAVALRVIVPPGAPRTRFAVAVADPAGRRATLGEVELAGLPSSLAGKLWAQELRVPLAAARAAGIDQVSALTLTARSTTGEIWLLDSWTYRAGAGIGSSPAVPRVDIGALRVAEGNAGPRTVQVPISVSGTVGRDARVWLSVIDWTSLEPPRTMTVTLRPGQRTISIPVSVVGDDRDDEPELTTQVVAEAVTGVQVGDYVGGVTVLDDDPDPVVSVTPRASAVKGAPLRWSVSLSAPTDRYIFGFLGSPVAPDTVPGGSPEGTVPEMTTDDVPPEVLGLEVPPDPAVPLSSYGLFLFVEVPPGQTSAVVEVPTVAGTAPGPRQVVFVVPDDFEFLPGAVTSGTITDP